MKIEFDFSELTEFTNNLASEYAFDTTMMTITQKIAKILHSDLLLLTPVDTGNLRKMWSAGDNLKFTVENVNDGYVVTLINAAKTDKNFMYGKAVNDGHKTVNGGWVMGKFFVEKAILKTSNSKQIESIIMKELQKWWEGC